jgi:hypothetical protein
MSEPIYCDIKGQWCRCHDWGKRCDDFDEDDAARKYQDAITGADPKATEKLIDGLKRSQ